MSVEPIQIATTPRRRPRFPPHVADAIRHYLHEHLDEKVTSGLLAQRVHLSLSYFCHSFKASFGQTLPQYVRTLRMEKACRLLLETDLPLCDIALECGLNDQAYLCHCFRQRFGMPPSQWRRATQERYRAA